MLVVGHAGDFGPCGDPQHARARPNHGQSVAGLVGGSQCGLAFGIGGLNAKCVQRNILRGRAKGHSQGAPHHGLQRHFGIIERHRHQAGHHGDLCQQQPASTASQKPGQDGNRHAVHQRGPDPLERIGQAHPAQVTNRGAVNASLTQPEAQGSEHQQQR